MKDQGGTTGGSTRSGAPWTPRLALGPQLPIFDPAQTGVPHPQVSASRAEKLGFDVVWVGDHLAFHPPWLESLSCLAAAAAVTTRIRLGTSVLLAAMRQPAWLAKQVATLQHLSADRLIFGVGVGGENPAEWDAAGVPARERGARTNAFLSALPALLAAEPVHVPAPYDLDVPPLRPPAALPPLWIGGRADSALRRAARYGDGWLGAFVDAGGVPERRERLEAFAFEAGRPTPQIGLSVFVHVSDEVSRGEEEARAFFRGLYDLPLERVRRYCEIGGVDAVAEGLAAYIDAGVRVFTLVPVAVRPYDQFEGLAHVRELLFAHTGKAR